MEFEIKRTSVFCDNKKPCKESKKIYTKNDHICYKIEINTLEELIKFSNKYGKLVFASKAGEGLPYIEIYDDYRE